MKVPPGDKTMANDYLSPKFGNMAHFTFLKKNAAPGLTNSDLHYSDIATAGSSVTQPYDGSVVGLTAIVTGSGTALVNELTAGTLTFKVTEDGTEATKIPGVAVTFTSGCVALVGHSGYGTFEPGTFTFSAGARLGVSVTTSTDLQLTGGAASSGSPTVKADLFVIYNPI
jgi:hypothetical protein